MGISDTTLMHCRQCGERTPHETDWQSETPTLIETKCLLCGREVQNNGRGFNEVVIRRGETS